MFNFFKIFKKAKCNHEFDFKDIHNTGIILEKPKTNDYMEWEKYYKTLFNYKHISFTHRILWPCCKCGKVFNGSCGIDILKHGKMITYFGNTEEIKSIINKLER